MKLTPTRRQVLEYAAGAEFVWRGIGVWRGRNSGGCLFSEGRRALKLSSSGVMQRALNDLTEGGLLELWPNSSGRYTITEAGRAALEVTR